MLYSNFFTKTFIPLKMKINSSNRIVFNPKTFRGKAIIRHTRISVDLILELLANDWAIEEILAQYPQLEKEDILSALDYSSKRIKREEVIFLHETPSR